MADPQTQSRRSFVYRRLVEIGATFDGLGHAVRTDHDAAGAAVVLCDLSLTPRTGFKGRGALDWLRAQGVSAADANNRSARTGDTGLVCRLAPGEALILSDQGTVDRLDAACREGRPDGCFHVPRADSHAWFRISGAQSARVLAQLCGVDLRPGHFDNLEIAQTIIARVSAIVVRDDMGDRLGYHLLADSASALYLWDCLVEAMAAFDGVVVGTDTLAQW